MSLPPIRRLAVVVVIVATLVASVLLVAQDQVTLKLRSDAAAGEARYAEYLSGLLGVPLTHGNRLTVHTNGDQLYPAMLAAIRGATRRISFETYIYEAGQMADAFTRAFAEAAGRGVRVNLVIDAVGGSGLEEAQVKALEAAGCHIVRFNSPRWYSLEEVNYRTHRKILVIDGAIAFTGGAGVADHWMGDAQDAHHWRDTMIEIAGPAARPIEAGFYENFTEAAPETVPELDDSTTPAGAAGGTFVVRSSPSGGANEMKRLYLMALAGARHSVDITTPYFIPDESSLWSMADAVGRGVTIRLLVEGEITDAMPVKHASRRFYDRLLELGIGIYEYQPTMMHAKTLVVDGAWSMFGSANFDNRSLELNDELNVAVADRGFAARLLEDFENDVRASRRLTLESWRARSWTLKVREHFWALFGEIF
jgi:cardiolipin synthase